MKLNKILFTLLTLLTLLCATNGLSAKTQVSDNLPGVAAQPVEYFYTGKPYDADLGNYTFKYRNYDPTINRWLSVDPSGFPDGANNQIYACVPTYEVDPFGLEVKRMVYTYGNGAFSIQYDVSIDKDAGVTLNSATYSGLSVGIYKFDLLGTRVSGASSSTDEEGAVTWSWSNEGTLSMEWSIGTKITWPVEIDLTIGQKYLFPFGSGESYTFE